jgi:glyoxylase I family protein
MNDAAAPPDQPPDRPRMFSHVAYMSEDTAATADFYSGILGMELVNAVLDDKIPSTGEPIPYFHSFFRLGDGSTIAFFEAPDLPPALDPPHPAYRTFQHVAMQVPTPADVDRWHAWLEANGIDVLGPVDHKITYGIYFFDPNGIRLEINTPLHPSWNDNATAAKRSLEEWTQAKELARANGEDLALVLGNLTRERSHLRATR